MPVLELTLLAVRGFVVPGLTRSKHGMHHAGEATGSSNPGDLPTKALADLFIGMREPTVGSVGNMGDHGPNEGAPEPTIGPGGDGPMTDRPEARL